MLRIDFEDGFPRRHLLSDRFQDPLQVRAHGMGLGHETGRGSRQALGQSHVLDLVTERLLYPL